MKKSLITSKFSETAIYLCYLFFKGHPAIDVSVGVLAAFRKRHRAFSSEAARFSYVT